MSARKNIGGVLDLAAYAALSGRSREKGNGLPFCDQHRPTDPAALAADIRRLYGAGHSADYIATQLQLPLDEVINVLAEAAE